MGSSFRYLHFGFADADHPSFDGPAVVYALRDGSVYFLHNATNFFEGSNTRSQCAAGFFPRISKAMFCMHLDMDAKSFCISTTSSKDGLTVVEGLPQRVVPFAFVGTKCRVEIISDLQLS